MKNQIICKTPNFQVKIHCNRAKWADVYNSYPLINKGDERERDLEADKVFQSIFDSYENGFYQGVALRNACATRLSLALLDSGFSHIKARNNPFKITNKNHKHYGKYIETGVKNLCDFLIKVYGKADVVVNAKMLDGISHKEGKLQLIQDNINKLQRTQGIYLMFAKQGVWSDASGHITLWHHINDNKGNAIGKNNYVEKAQSVYFWSLL